MLKFNRFCAGFFHSIHSTDSHVRHFKFDVIGSAVSENVLLFFHFHFNWSAIASSWKWTEKDDLNYFWLCHLKWKMFINSWITCFVAEVFFFSFSWLEPNSTCAYLICSTFWFWEHHESRHMINCYFSRRNDTEKRKARNATIETWLKSKWIIKICRHFVCKERNSITVENTSENFFFSFFFVYLVPCALADWRMLQHIRRHIYKQPNCELKNGKISSLTTWIRKQCVYVRMW